MTHNFQPIYPADTHGQMCNCYHCGARVKLANCVADLNGPAFRAYYCPLCVAALQGDQAAIARQWFN